jgi:hypothetical protein
MAVRGKMAKELEVLKRVCQGLGSANIPYMLTGSFAANFYATPRMTRDIDIVIQIMESDLDNFYNAFKDDFYLSREALAEAVRHKGMFNIIHNNTILKIDFIVRKNSPYRFAEFQRKQLVQYDSSPVWIVSPEDLIISKLFWAKDSFSEMQIKDVKNLFSTMKNLDLDYIDKWVEDLELKEVYQKVEAYG